MSYHKDSDVFTVGQLVVIKNQFENRPLTYALWKSDVIDDPPPDTDDENDSNVWIYAITGVGFSLFVGIGAICISKIRFQRKVEASEHVSYPGVSV